MIEPNTPEFEVPVEGTDRRIAISRPDQGSRIVQLASTNPGLGINIWEGANGDDLEGFRARWEEWVSGTAATFPYVDARFGNVAYLLRGSIPTWAAASLQYARREDVRAGVARDGVPMRDRSTGVPLIRP